MAFKIYLLPFNFMLPSLAEKSDLKIFGLLSIPVSAVLFVVMLRFFTVAFHDSGSFISETNSMNFIPDVKWNIMFAIIGTLSILAGNLVVLWQQNLKKIAAFLVIAQSGFIIMGLASPSTAGTEAMLYNVLLFTASGCGVFYCLKLFEEKYNIITLSALKGLGKTDPLLIIAFVIFLLSFAGFPLTGGFTGRLLLLPALTEHGYIAPVMIMVLSSIALLYFIFRFAYSSFSAVPDKAQNKTSTLHKIILIMLLIPVTFFGIFPEPFTHWIRFCREVFKTQIL
jgi:NADH-quinone oxidoreductase subunit N